MWNRFAAKSNSPWFEHLARSEGPPFRLFCFPHAGGNAQVFRQWQQYFHGELDVYLVHLPGRGRRIGEPPFTRLSALIDVLAEQSECEMQDQFALYGHSMGALLSFELGRELFRRYGRGPRQLFLSGCRAPQVHRSEPRTFNLPDEEFIASVRRLNGTPDELLEDAETREIFLPALRADFEMVETYEYQSGQPLPCPLTVYGGLQDSDVAIESLRAWEAQTTATCKVRMFDGDHFFIHNSGTNFIQALRSDVLRAFQHLCVPEG